MGRKAKQEKTEFTVIVEDLNGNILTDEDLRNIVVDCIYEIIITRNAE